MCAACVNRRSSAMARQATAHHAVAVDTAVTGIWLFERYPSRIHDRDGGNGSCTVRCWREPMRGNGLLALVAFGKTLKDVDNP